MEPEISVEAPQPTQSAAAHVWRFRFLPPL